MTLAPEVDGVHVMAADSSKAYHWRTVAVLSEPGFTTDLWLGNYCIPDRSHAVVVYAPRGFTNHEELMERGGFTAVVNLDTGKVKKLPITSSLAYFNPSCDTTTHRASLTQIKGAKTKLISVGVNGKTTPAVTVRGEVTSAVPTSHGFVAALGHHIVEVGRDGKATALTATQSVPYSIRTDAGGGIDFLDQTASHQYAKRLAGKHITTLATGGAGKVGLASGSDGKVFLTGGPTNTSTLPAQVKRLHARADADISTHGDLAVNQVMPPKLHAGVPHQGRTAKQRAHSSDGIQLRTTVTATNKSLNFTAGDSRPYTKSAGSGAAASPALAPSPAISGHGHAQKHAGTVQPLSTTSTSDTTDVDRHCSIARNDPNTQALQPTSNQIEWAVDMAVRGDLTSTWLTQGDWRTQEGGTVNPQGMFPLPALTTGGRIPAQVLLGVLAQESNLWQAGSGAIPGQTANPLTSANGFYGHPSSGGLTYWQIDWSKSDCGYGVGQVTDGMLLPAYSTASNPSMTAAQQRAIAVDYAVNIAKSAQILANKWNELHKAGQTITINDDNPAYIENWFAAVWNYNEGFNPPGLDPSGNWGLGWYNNPANPIYPPTRGPFLDTYYSSGALADAAHPQDWPYEEKVMGWAAWSIDTGYSYGSSGQADAPGSSGYNSAGFYPAWWGGGNPLGQINRENVKPPLNIFCTAADNDCNPNDPPPCEIDHIQGCDVLHWWHTNTGWKTDCAGTCGHENMKYVTLRTEPGRGYGGQYGDPDCTTNGLPTGSLIIDSVPTTVPTYRSSCPKISNNHGTFTFTFLPDSNGYYEAHGDLNQIGGGYDAHFWYAHTRDVDTGVSDINLDSGWYDQLNKQFVPSAAGVQEFTSQPVTVAGNMAITGDWKLNQQLTGWQTVRVHVPDTGMTAQQAIYTIHTGSGTTNRVINAHNRANEWVSLGDIYFSGSSWQGVTLTNFAPGATADNSIAWDAVAFTPLPAKPANTVVQLGDSYSSGTGVGDYYTNSDTGPHISPDDPQPATYDACLRSKRSWIRQTVLPGTTQSIGTRSDGWDTSLDFHSVACSGATTTSAQQTGQYGEIPQIYSGFINPDTTLIAMTMGGNDAKFSSTLTDCVIGGCPSDATVQPRLTQASTNVAAFLAVVHAIAPNAQIIVMGYPALFDTSNVTLCASKLPLSDSDAVSIAQWGRDFNADLAAAVSGANTGGKASFRDPSAAFSGHLLCDSSEALHGFTETPSSDIASDKSWTVTAPSSYESYHPNELGAELYAQTLQQGL
ncbi:SGNH/GDSL hydrolase family protein [Streptomyces sp. Tue6028]|uniref:golvesin C-terminal-like domain-containing protein n=1 Tax=Streptomyces sp. Tue6028 TaxID=2036037 RepID=UPI003D74C317